MTPLALAAKAPAWLHEVPVPSAGPQTEQFGRSEAEANLHLLGTGSPGGGFRHVSNQHMPVQISDVQRQSDQLVQLLDALLLMEPPP